MNQIYEAAIGLEIHAELSTKTKMFCGCKNAFGAQPNTLCCPVCLGLPGALPVINRQAIDDAVRMGHALHCSIRRIVHMDRKHYFYPDLPKAYQISQFDKPLCENGYLDIPVSGGVRRIGITRIHVEEDAGKIVFRDSFDGSLVDYNRCGIPLIEIVSEPDLHSAAEAKIYMESVADILRCLDISDVKMQEGSMRADVNVSVRPYGQQKLGTRTEMKNVCGFGAVYRAVLHEIQRQTDILRRGEEITQETRRWNDAAGRSELLRTKENAQDYRFFPDPDIPPFMLSEDHIQWLKDTLPELPADRTKRYIHQYGLPPEKARLLAANRIRADFFDACAALKRCKGISLYNWMTGDMARILNERHTELNRTALTPEHLTELIALVEKGAISGTAAKTVLEEIIIYDVSPTQLVKERALEAISDTDIIQALVSGVLAENPKAVANYKAGKTNAVGFLVGQCMKSAKGQGNPVILRDMLLSYLET